MHQLEWLDLNGTGVTDAGLEQLKDLNKLNSLILDGSKVTVQGVKKLREALPNCNIHSDAAASAGEAPAATPEALVEVLKTAINSGDPKQVRALIAAETPLEKRTADVFAEFLISQEKLGAAAEKKFGLAETDRQLGRAGLVVRAKEMKPSTPTAHPHAPVESKFLSVIHSSTDARASSPKRLASAGSVS